MEQSKQDDNQHWGLSGSLRVRGRVYRETADYRAESFDPYQVVHPQEPVWVLDLRLFEPDGEGIVVLRVVLRPTGGTGYWPGTAEAEYLTSGRDGSLK